MSAVYGLAIEAVPFLGQTHREWAEHAVVLANRLQCPIKVTANEISITVFPGETADKVVKQFLSMQEMITE